MGEREQEQSKITPKPLAKLKVLLPLLFSIIAILAPHLEKIIPVPDTIGSPARGLASLIGAAILLAFLILFGNSKSRTGLNLSGIIGFIVGLSLAIVYLLRYNHDPIFPSILNIPQDKILEMAFILHFDAWVMCFAGWGFSYALKDVSQLSSEDMTEVPNSAILDKEENKPENGEITYTILKKLILLSRWEDLENITAAKGVESYRNFLVILARMVGNPFSANKGKLLRKARRQFRLLWLINLVSWPTQASKDRKALLLLASRTIELLSYSLKTDNTINSSNNRVEILKKLSDRMKAIMGYPFYFGFDRIYDWFRNCISDAIKISSNLTLDEKQLVRLDNLRNQYGTKTTIAYLNALSKEEKLAIAYINPLAQFRSHDWRELVLKAYEGAEEFWDSALAIPKENYLRRSYFYNSAMLYAIAAAGGGNPAKSDDYLFELEDFEVETTSSLERLIEIAADVKQLRAAKHFQDELLKFKEHIASI